MQCPVDKTTLVMTERAGVEIDYCPTCRGVWLDRDELDKIVERSQPEYGRPSDNKHDAESQKQKKRGSFLGDIFGGLGGE